MNNEKAMVDDRSSPMEESHDTDLRSVPIASLPLRSICDDNREFTTDSILRLTWGVVLGIYTGESEVSFGSIRRETTSNESPAEERLHRMAMDTSTPIIELLKQSSSNSCHQISGLEGCDTVLMLDVGVGAATDVLARPDMANVSTAKRPDSTSWC